ncbi:hypothetical protein SASPL_153566 [Salvia splendens]|uniref:Cytochrome P450 n=1 Tax=Salvia splendens TaxID=180675 RepID=A0A8X8YYG3_SALSN|nr:hypothetical protein SASPL_153566 [Salvia splendens]
MWTLASEDDESAAIDEIKKSERSRVCDSKIVGSDERGIMGTDFMDWGSKTDLFSSSGFCGTDLVQSYRGVREEETSLMVEKIRELGASSNPVNLSNVMASLTNDVICRVALGKKYGSGSDFKETFAEIVELLGVVPFWEYIPWLRWMRRVRERREGDGVELDFVDIFLDFQRENASRTPIEDDTIKAIVLNIFGAGTDTTFTALEWAMTELVPNPDTMITLQNEVREVAGSKDEIDEHDLEKMPYLKAAMKESLRDNSLWKYPEEFRSERFLGMDIDFRGLHLELTSFGADRRGCPGITFAVAVDELALGKLVHKFDFRLPNGAKMKDLDLS